TICCFFSSRRRHTSFSRDWSSEVCSSDLETGYRAEEMHPIVSFYTSPGFADEKLHLFEARGLTKGEMRPDADEFVEVEELTLEEIGRASCREGVDGREGRRRRQQTISRER